MSDPSAVAQAFRLQSRFCIQSGAPFCGALLERAAADVEAGGPTRALMAPWAEAPLETQFKQATPLRWLGALHDLALSGDDPAFSATYPCDGGGDADAAWIRARIAMREYPERLAAFMAHEPQTNEVRRSVCLIGGFLEVARVTGLPLRVFELGASAGLNQGFDRFRYDLGAAGAWGDPAARVILDTDWRGAPPPLGAPLTVVDRAACDRAPIDLGNAAARRRLKAYVWADQADRLARLDAVMAETIGAGVSVEMRDAVDFTSARVDPRPGTASVLFHSVFWQYMPEASQTVLALAIADVGARASAAAPFAWLRMEPAPATTADMEVRLTLWPGGEDRLLAKCHPHGAWVAWEG